MALLILSLSVLFGASLVAYVVIRRRAPVAWPPPDMPGLPPGLWVSTAAIIVTGVVMEMGLRRIRRGDRDALSRTATASFLLGIAFLIIQAMNWRILLAAKATLYGFTFFMLTGLHAAHVIGGLIPLGIVVRKARRRLYTAASHAGVVYCTMYWHFLAVVWIVMFTVMFL
jgi:cytochrome c oxidase subunit 3